MKFPKSILTIATLAIGIPVYAASETPVFIKYAGFGYDTGVEIVEDGMPVNLLQADGKGTFGHSSLAITSEFVLSAEPIESCPDGYPIHAWVTPDNYWALTLTFPDHSQIFGLFNEGWICLTADMRFYFGETYGAFVGGSKRFEDAEGEWTSHFEGVNLDPSIGFRSITGDIIGSLSTPE